MAQYLSRQSEVWGQSLGTDPAKGPAAIAARIVVAKNVFIISRPAASHGYTS